MSNRWDNQFHSVRWPLLLAFVRAAAAALVVFVGLSWLGFWLWKNISTMPLPLQLPLTARQSTAVLFLLIVTALLSAVGVGVSIGYVESRALRRRIRTLNDAALLWSNERLGHRIIVEGGDDELAELAGSLNGMAERLEEHVAALQRVVEKNEALYQQARALAALEERSRLARDLHDSVSQQLFAIGMTAGAASKVLERSPEKARPLVEQTEAMAAKAQAEMRALLLHLRPIELEGRSLREAMERFLHDLCTRHQIRYDLQMQLSAEIGEGMEAQLFRITQEAVSNVIRHATAKGIQVRLIQNGAHLLLSIRDDGQGFDPQAVRDGSYGMHSIRERAEEMGGRLDVRTAPGQGTEVRVTVSLVTE